MQSSIKNYKNKGQDNDKKGQNDDPKLIKSCLERIHKYQKFGSKLGLHRIRTLLSKLGNPEKGLNVIHVAGTNGKGSVCRFLSKILTDAGYHTGMFTSPYLCDFRERIEYDNEMITESELVECANIVLQKAEEMGKSSAPSESADPPTEFEIVTAIAFLYFSRKKPDFLILEVGLGGTGDSTNVVERPLISIITSISYDHMDVLGNSLVSIAKEKAGIIKPNCPVLASVDDEDARNIIKNKARELGCEFYDGKKAKISNIVSSISGYDFHLDYENLFSDDVKIRMLGEHQVKNAALAIVAILLLNSMEVIDIKPGLMIESVGKVSLPGRIEIVSEDPLIIIDAAHNRAGIKALTEVIKQLFNNKKILILLSIMKDKEADVMTAELSGLGADFLVTKAENERSMEPEELAKMIQNCKIFPDWKDAVSYISEASKDYDLTLITGSFYLIGPVRSRFLK